MVKVYSLTIENGSFFPGEYVAAAIPITAGVMEVEDALAQRIVTEFGNAYSLKPYRQPTWQLKKQPTNLGDPKVETVAEPVQMPLSPVPPSV